MKKKPKNNLDSLTIPFTGKARYALNYFEGRININQPLAAVTCRLETNTEECLALLDTGAEWSVCPLSLVEELALPPEGSTIRYSTRKGTYSFTKYVLGKITLPALHGANLTLENVQILSSEYWDGPLVLGQRTFLDRLAFALIPRQPEFWYFADA